MGDYLKLFETTSEYETYISGEDVLLPNVSYCEDNNGIYYNPWVETRLIVKHNVTDISNPTAISYKYGTPTNLFDEIEVDGVVLPSVVAEYQFDTIGEHIVKYTLKDPTTIGENAFRNCYTTISVEIPSSVITVGSAAFYECNNLTNISIPDNVITIGGSSFRRCTSLTSVTIGKSVENIEINAFEGCSNLTDVYISDLKAWCEITIADIRSAPSASHLYLNSNEITDLIIPNNVTSISNYAFSGYSSLTSVTIPSGVTSIGDYAFATCSGLTSITIPNSVTSIGASAFSSCSGLTSVTIPSGVTSIGQSAFYNCTSLITITSNASTAPTIYSQTFRLVKTNGTLYVPIGSSGYNAWMAVGSSYNYYLGNYNWTKVEQ